MESEPNNSKKTRDPQKEIILAFYDLIIEKGYNNISIRNIRDKANVAIGTIYHHFPEGKPAIMKKLLLFFSTEILKINQVLISDEILSPDYLKSFINNLVKNVREYYSYYSAVLQALLSNPEFFKDIETMSIDYYRQIVIKVKNKEKTLADTPIELLIQAFKFINDTCNAYIQQHIFISPVFKSDEELIKFLSKLITYFIETEFKILF
ncbi:MAG: TetR/AcrR family transcriptional regulator [Candidatus Lokiarchaeota archaeon]|nr:TetR/AcrR family transcriptional regulator [Candidatus Lokiarchaeota archaeon]